MRAPKRRQVNICTCAGARGQAPDSRRPRHYLLLPVCAATAVRQEKEDKREKERERKIKLTLGSRFADIHLGSRQSFFERESCEAVACARDEGKQTHDRERKKKEVSSPYERHTYHHHHREQRRVIQEYIGYIYIYARASIPAAAHTPSS